MTRRKAKSKVQIRTHYGSNAEIELLLLENPIDMMLPLLSYILEVFLPRGKTT
jgi:hypothetical protein